MIGCGVKGETVTAACSRLPLKPLILALTLGYLVQVTVVGRNLVRDDALTGHRATGPVKQ